MAVAELTRMAQDYLQAIWKAAEWAPGPVAMNDLAARLGVTTSTVSSGVKRLREDGLVRHERYGAIELTETGRIAALQMVRRHRLLETYLVERLGYTWDQVHDEAEHLEHAVSDFFVERISEELGHPSRDPHGDAIPTADGALDSPDAELLSQLTPNQRGVVIRISDENPELLRYLSEHGIGLDARVVVSERRDFAGTLAFSLETTDGEVSHELGLPAAEAIWVTREA